MQPSDNQKQAVGLRIKEARSALGLTQKELCAKAGMKLPSLRDYELGKRIPGGEAVADLVRVNINANWLLTGEGPIHLADLQSPSSPPGALDIARMRLAIEAVEEGLIAVKRVMAPAKKADLVLAVYDLLEDATEASKGKVLKLVKLAA